MSAQGFDDVSVAGVVKALGSGGPALLGRAIDPVAQRRVTETETHRGWFRPRPTAAGSGTAGLGRRDASQLPQGSTNARVTRICSPWADIGSHLRCCCRCQAELQQSQPTRMVPTPFPPTESPSQEPHFSPAAPGPSDRGSRPCCRGHGPARRRCPATAVSQVDSSRPAPYNR